MSDSPPSTIVEALAPEVIDPGDTTPAERRRRIGHDEDELAEPLRQRSVHEDTRPLNRHLERVNPATGERSDVVEVYHKPGSPLPEPSTGVERLEPFADTEARDTEAGEAQQEVRDERRLPVGPSTQTPELSYATRDNIVHPGPTPEAAELAQQVADETFRARAVVQPADSLRAEDVENQTQQVIESPTDARRPEDIRRPDTEDTPPAQEDEWVDTDAPAEDEPADGR